MTGPSTTKDEEELVYCNAEFWFLRAIVPKFRLEVCKMKKSKIPKLCQNIGLDELFLKKIL